MIIIRDGITYVELPNLYAINGYHPETDIPSTKHLARLPNFVKEGFAALTNGGNFYADDSCDWLAVVTGEKPGFCDLITLKEGAPSWLVSEYEDIKTFLAS